MQRFKLIPDIFLTLDNRVSTNFRANKDQTGFVDHCQIRRS